MPPGHDVTPKLRGPQSETPSVTSGRKKPRFVHQYLGDDPLSQFEKDEILTVSESVVIRLKKLDRDYHKITVEQWNHGNSRILQDIMKEDRSDSVLISQYLEYTKTINRYFSKYVRGSVLLYDKNIASYSTT